MTRALSNKLYRNFTKGLITESSELTYPENACLELDNCIIYKKGNASRRYGLDLEPNFGSAFGATATAAIDNYAIKEFRWESVANEASTNFLVYQNGTNILFYDLSSSAVSTGKKSFSFSLTSYLSPGTTSDVASLCEVQFASGKGYLFIVGDKFEPVMVEYLPDVDAIKVTKIYIQIRDFQGLNDDLANDEEPTSLSTAHNYNLLNQGWYDSKNDASGPLIQYFDSYGGVGTQNAPPQTPISDYHTSQSRYPGNNKQWWVAKNSSTGAFDPALLTKFSFGSGRAPRGHFVLNAFYKDRSAVSGLTGVPVESTSSRPSSVAFFSGRVWYVCGSEVYYSQILTDKAKAGFCYQEADPTSEDFNALVASDGGVVSIPEMGKGLKLLPAAGGILVFANNGIWHVSGTAGGFSAVDISTTRVSPIGTDNPNTVVDARDGIYWWGRVGIMGLVVQTGAGGTSFDLQSVSEQTIQTLYNEIPLVNKTFSKGVYDPATNTVQWLYNDANTHKYLYNKILVMDLTLGAFYTWTLPDTGYPNITGVFLSPTLTVTDNPYPTSIKPTFIKYTVAVPVVGAYFFTMGYFRDYRFVDWDSYLQGGYDFLSVLMSGYELLDDAMRKKELNYIFTYLRKTEQNYIATDGDYRADNPSSCLYQTRWDWADTNTNNRWTNKVEVYRHHQMPLVDETNLKFDTGSNVVISKNKVRGHGRSIQFRFESNGPGKDFDIIGWAVPISGNTNP